MAHVGYSMTTLDNRLGIPLSAALSTSPPRRDPLIVHYAELGYSTKEIHALLRDVHGIQMRLDNLFSLNKQKNSYLFVIV